MMLTPFEERALNPLAPNAWTSLSEEAALLSSIAAASPRIRVVNIGADPLGNVLRRIDIAYPTAESGDSRRDKILLVSQQHGGEASGRDAMLQLIRDLAYTTNAEEIAYLSKVQVVCMPTTNPSGFAELSGWTYENANGVNLNRDHLSLTQPEARAIQKVITQKRPCVIVDSHENGTPTGVRAGFSFGMARNQNKYLRALSSNLCDRLRAAISAQTEMVPYVFPGAMPADHALHNIAPHRNAISLLIETDMFTSGSVADPRVTRVAGQLLAYRETIAFHSDFFYQIRAAHITAATEVMLYAAAGATQRIVEFGNGRVGYLPRAYRLTEAEYGRTSHIFDVFEIEHSETTDGILVPVNQRDARLMPFIFDENAALPPINAVRAEWVPIPQRKLILLPRDGWRLAPT